MRRREFNTMVVGGSVRAGSLPSRAQPLSTAGRLGVLATVAESDPEWQAEVGAS
jgi:hypothetical protein